MEPVFIPCFPGGTSHLQTAAAVGLPMGNISVFQSEQDGRANIWATREQAGLFRKSSPKPVQLTVGPMNLHSPLPSLDGKRLFVVGVQPRGELVRYDMMTRQFVPFLSGIRPSTSTFPEMDSGWLTILILKLPFGVANWTAVSGFSSPSSRCEQPSPAGLPMENTSRSGQGAR